MERLTNRADTACMANITSLIAIFTNPTSVIAIFTKTTGVMAILNPIVLGAIAIVTLAFGTGVVARFIELVEDGQFRVRR